MLKPKKSEDSEELTFMGHNIDPEIQKKVDDYMEIDESTLAEKTEIPEVPASKEGPTSTAPLLPTDQLPELVKGDAEPKTIDIKHFDEPEETPPEPISEPEESAVPELKVVDKPKKVIAPISEDAPLDSELIDLTTDPDLIAAPGFDEELDKTKTIGELAEAIPMDDTQLNTAIDEIVAQDADKLLEVEDQKNQDDAEIEVAKPKKTKKPRGNFFKACLKNPLYIKLTIFAVLVLIVILTILPTSRYFVLNLAGVRVSTSIKMLDDKTGLPLKNVELVVNNKSAKSDGDGNVRVDKVKLGKQEIIIKKLAFAEVKKKVTLGWGSNPLGEQRLVPTGTQFTLIAKDFASEKPVTIAEVNFGDSSAKFNASGEAILTVPTVEEEEIEVSVSANSYREEKVKINVETTEKINVQMVPAKKHVFVSKQKGKFDLYKVDVDGKNEEVILEATGIEKEESLSLSTHPKKPITAFSSTRENTRNQDGFLLSTLNIIYLDTKEVVKVTQSERIQIVDWSGDKLIYVKITQGASQGNPNRHKIMSYDIESGSEKELATTNYFNDIVSVNGVIYYSPAIYQINGKVGLYRINADGTNKKTIFDKEVWNIFRTAYDKFSFSVGQDWYELSLASDEVKKVGGAPAVLKSKIYINSPNGKQSIWVDERDGKSVLLNYTIDQKTDKVLITESGIRNPIYWLDDDHLVYRIADGTEVADYIMSLSGGAPKKIRDVTNTVGIDRWYYF